MLEGLDKIEWSKLRHAYGAAEDVPGVLRGLASKHQSERKAAIHALYGNIWHQGTVYEATAFAVPFLIELAADPQVESRSEILILLGSIANGNSYLDVHQHLDLFKNIYGGEMQTEKWKSDLAQELLWVKAARDAVLAGLDRYVAMLRDSDWRVRESTAFLLACLGRDAAVTCLAIENALLSETEPRVRISFLLALGVLAKELPATVGNAATDATGSVRLAAGLSMVRLLRENTPSAAVEILLEGLELDENVDRDFEDSPWINNDDLSSLVTGYLTFLGQSRAAEIAPSIIKALKLADGWTAGVSRGPCWRWCLMSQKHLDDVNRAISPIFNALPLLRFANLKARGNQNLIWA